MRLRRTKRKQILALAIMTISLGAPIWGQQAVDDTQTPSTDAPNPGTPINERFQPALKTTPWLGAKNPLRWGDFYIGDFTAARVDDSIRPDNGGPKSTLDLTIFHTSVIFDKHFKRQELILQLQPQLAVFDGHAIGNAGLNNALTFGSPFNLTSRLTMTLKNSFSQVNSRQLLPEDRLAIDSQAGNLLQNSFLANSGSYVSEAVSAAFNYAISPRTTLSISPNYTYSKLTSDQQLNYLENGQDVGLEAAWTRALTQRQNLGLDYSGELLRANSTNVPTANVYFNTATVFYSYQIAKTYWIRGQAGENFATYPGGAGTTNYVAGGVELIKGFSRSELAIDYNRGRVNTNFVTGRVAERGDLAYTVRPFSRLIWAAGLGYYQELGADPKTKGDYVSSSISYMLSRTGISAFATYTYMYESSNTPQLLSGTRNLLSAGIKWQAGLVPNR